MLEDRALLDELTRLRANGMSIVLTVPSPRHPERIDPALEGSAGFDTVQAT